MVKALRIKRFFSIPAHFRVPTLKPYTNQIGKDKLTL